MLYSVNVTLSEFCASAFWKSVGPINILVLSVDIYSGLVPEPLFFGVGLKRSPYNLVDFHNPHLKTFIFGDNNLTWNTPNPDFTDCFENTILIWIPCAFLWLFLPIKLFYLHQANTCDISFNLYNVSKLVAVTLLAVTALSDIAAYIFVKNTQRSVDIYTPLLRFCTFNLFFILTYTNIKCGIRSSLVLFLFSFLLVFCGAPQFRTQLNYWSSIYNLTREINYDSIKCASYLTYFAAAVIVFILNCFADVTSDDPNQSMEKNICLDKNSSSLSKLVLSWFDSLAWRGYRTTLTADHVWKLGYKVQTAYIVKKFELKWLLASRSLQIRSTNTDKEVPLKLQTLSSVEHFGDGMKTEKKLSVIKLLFQTFGWHCAFGFFLRLLASGLLFTNPYILKLFLAFVDKKDDLLWHGFFFVFLFFCTRTLRTLLEAHNLYIMRQIGLQMRSTMVSMIYKKALKISNGSRTNFTHGKILNLMGVDAQIFPDSMPFCIFLITAPIEIGISLYFLLIILGPCTLVGVAVLVILVFTNGLIVSRIKTFENERTKYKDERVKLISEALSAMKVLKMYAYEHCFEEQIKQIRNNEVKVLKQSSYFQAVSSFVWICTPMLTTVITFGTYVMLSTENILDAERAFVSLALINIIQFSFRTFPSVINAVIKLRVSTDRIGDFLNAEEMDSNAVSHDQRVHPITIEDGNFSWENRQGTTVLSNINVKVPSNSLVAVVGSVGCGKSSLMSAILGDMYKKSGFVNTLGSIAYIPQQAWMMQNTSLKDNITFGSSEKNSLYNTILEACALTFDLEILPDGEQTKIGENGVNLSGGQKQRVSLARAVFSEADIYLLDDPLSAVDVHVGKHIFEEVIGPNGLLNKKTRILVTHDINYLQQVDFIYVLQNGTISVSGTFDELMKKKNGSLISIFASQFKESDAITATEETVNLRTDMEKSLKTQPRKSCENESGKESEKESEKNLDVVSHKFTTRTEKMRTGGIGWNTSTYYLKAFGPVFLIITILSTIFYMVSGVLKEFWLSTWVQEAKSLHHDDRAKQYLYLGIYGLFFVVQGIGITTKIMVLQLGLLNAAKYIHNRLANAVFHWPVSTFDEIPSGRILNRFGSDMNVLDTLLPQSVRNLLLIVASFLTTFFIISYNLPAFLSVLVPSLIIGRFIQKISSSTFKQVQRLDSAYKSKIYSHFHDSIWGFQSIKAYNVQTQFIKVVEEKIDLHEKISYVNVVLMTWLKFRLDFIGVIIVLSTTVFAVLSRGTVPSAFIGLSIVYALHVTLYLLQWVMTSSEIEMNVVAIERVKEYSEIEPEAAWVLPTDDEVIPKNWPNLGTLEFRNYELRYQKDLEPVLKGISFKVMGGEKIGIVGRTGAGKSSLTLGLFRIIESYGGSILIDGVDISKIGLHKLRNGLTVIPQDPVLFSGTLRMNLDPVGRYSDASIWWALELVDLRSHVSSLSENLLYKVDEGGSNFSVGQKQLICLARTLLRKTKILVLDEATAAIDPKTESHLQATIQKEFVHCTVLTIAHRLNTVMYCDRIMVMDQGRIIEFDSPSILMKNKASVFYGMAKDAGLL